MGRHHVRDGVSIGVTLTMKERLMRSFVRRMLDGEYPLICARCGYNLSGTVSGSCTECGAPEPADTSDFRR